MNKENQPKKSRKPSTLATAEKDNDGENNTDTQEDVGDLRNELTKANAEIVRLTAKISEYKGTIDIVSQRNELLKLLSQRENTIERMSLEIGVLEQQLQAAVSAKFDALARSNADGERELTEMTLSFTNKQNEMGKRSMPSHKQNETENEECDNLPNLEETSDHEMDQSSESVNTHDDLFYQMHTRGRFLSSGDTSESGNKDGSGKNEKKVKASSETPHDRRLPLVRIKKMKLDNEVK